MRYLIVLAFVLQAAVSFSQTKQADPELQLLLNALRKLENDPALKNGQVGFYLASSKDGKPVASLNPDLSLTPASSLKLLTTAAAYSILGPDYRFETYIEYDGTIDEKGTLHGNLYIRGGGDPTLASPLFKGSDTVFTYFAKEIKRAGIKSINGAVIGDPSFFPADNPIPGGWIWADIGNYFGAGVYGLNYRENAFDVFFTTGAAGDSARIKRTDPQLPVTYINKVKAGGSGDNAYLYGPPYADFITLTGTVPANKASYEVSGAIPDPVTLAASVLVSELKREGIEASRPQGNLFLLQLKGLKTVSSRKIIYTHQSPALEKIIYWTNFKSHNMFAETLLRTIAVKAGKEGSVTEGVSQVKKYFSSKGVDLSAVIVTDGSGLSRSNVLTPRVQAECLRVIMNEPWFEKYLSSLHVYPGKIKAKSGYMNRVRSYAGYVKGKQESYVFSLIVNNYSCSAGEMREKMEKVMGAMGQQAD